MFTFFDMAWKTDPSVPWPPEELNRQMHLGAMLKMQAYQDALVLNALKRNGNATSVRNFESRN